MYPSHLRYTKEHEWIAVDGDRATMGITDFAQHELGDIVFVELPQSGQKFKAGDVVGTIESVKAVSEIYAPVAGEVVEINAGLNAEPEKVNRDPHGEGWICKFRIADSKEVQSLLDAAAYEALVTK